VFWDITPDGPLVGWAPFRLLRNVDVGNFYFVSRFLIEGHRLVDCPNVAR
jgi:hypothetical protein